MRHLLSLILLVLVAVPAAARAGLAKQCKRSCKPIIAEICLGKGKVKKRCKNGVIRACKQLGLDFCSGAATSTTLPDTGPGSTTTTLPHGGGGQSGGVMSLKVDEVEIEGDVDPRLFTLSIRIEYSVTTASAATQVGLDPSAFTVLDEDTSVIYQAEPASGAGDCSAGIYVTKTGPAVMCKVRFRLPRAVGALSTSGTHAKLLFNALGLRGEESWSK